MCSSPTRGRRSATISAGSCSRISSASSRAGSPPAVICTSPPTGNRTRARSWPGSRASPCSRTPPTASRPVRTIVRRPSSRHADSGSGIACTTRSSAGAPTPERGLAMSPWGAWLRRIARTRFDAPHAFARIVRPEAGNGDPWLAPGARVYRNGLVLVDRRLPAVQLASQFIEDAEGYHERNFDRLDFVDLIDRCLAVAGVEREQTLAVLDVGSGGGSSVFAACRLLPRATIVASDVSPA